MGVRINGVWHEELADPGAGKYDSAQQYKEAAGTASQQGGQNLNWGGGTGQAAAAPSAAAPTGGGGQGANLAAGTLLLQQAQQAAYQAYLNAKLALDTDQNAWQKAAQEAATIISQAGVTGTFNGMPTQAAIKQAADIAAQQGATMLSYATTFGVWGTPQQGQQTLAAQTQAAEQTGWYTPQAAQPGAPAGTTPAGAPPGWQAGQPVQTLARWQAEQTASQNYLTLLSNMRGPADWAQYQKVLGATPQGTQDLVRAAAGQYIPGGGATTGVQPEAANLNTLYQQATGANQQGQSQLSQMQQSLVAPNQMAPQTWNALQPSQQQMLLGVWESQGYSKEDAENLFKQSLPKYTMGAAQGGSSGTFRLQ